MKKVADWTSGRDRGVAECTTDQVQFHMEGAVDVMPGCTMMDGLLGKRRKGKPPSWREKGYLLYLLQCQLDAFAQRYQLTMVQLQCRCQGLVDMGQEMFEPQGGKACMTQLSSQSVGF